MILIPEVISILILNSLFFIFATIAFFLSIKIAIHWDFNKSTKEQYRLEKESFLVSTIIKYIFILKISLFLFFIFTLDKISDLITGAMCASGVITATSYGVYLLAIKLFNIYIFGLWLSISYLDTKREDLPYTKIKFELFIVAYLFFIIELILMWLMFSSIDIDKIVSCCGTLFSSSAQSPIGDIIRIEPTILLTIFYITSLLLFIFYKHRIKYLLAVTNILFIIISIITLISFFGTYIYELPTHHCPFCFLQKDYYYIGYLIYTLLFIGSFNGLNSGVMEALGEDASNSYRYSLIFNTLYIVLVTLYPISYYIKNGVWL